MRMMSRGFTVNQKTQKTQHYLSYPSLRGPGKQSILMSLILDCFVTPKLRKVISRNDGGGGVSSYYPFTP